MYARFLRQSGYTPDVTSEGHVAFHIGDWTYIIRVDERNQQSFELVLPGFATISSEIDRARISAAANYATSTTSVAKIYIVRDSVWASTELFVASPEDFAPLLTDCIAALASGAKTFIGQVQR